MSDYSDSIDAGRQACSDYHARLVKFVRHVADMNEAYVKALYPKILSEANDLLKELDNDD